MKTTFTALFLLTVVFSALVPTAVFATNPNDPTKTGGSIYYKETSDKEAYVVCGTIDADKDGIVDNPCKFSDIIKFINGLIMGWIIAGVTFATIGFTYAGYLYITSMGSEEKISHAHSIFYKTAFGLVFMLSAWLIAYTMERIFLRPEFIEKNSFLAEPKKKP